MTSRDYILYYFMQLTMVLSWWSFCLGIAQGIFLGVLRGLDVPILEYTLSLRRCRVVRAVNVGDQEYSKEGY